MNNHMTDGQLRAACDGELTPVELNHLNNCSSCQRRQAALQDQVKSVSQRLAFLDLKPGDSVPPAQVALSHFYNQHLIQKENWMKRIFSNTAFRIGMAFVLILAAVLAIPSTRAFADQLLNMFRVQQVSVIPVDFTGLQQLAGDSSLNQQIGQLLSNSVTMTKKPEKPVQATDASQASDLAGFSVRLPGDMTPSSITVQNGAAFSFKVDRSKAQSLLDEAGRNDLVLPQSIDGATISVNIPAGVSAAYGNCPQPTTGEQDMNLAGSMGRRYADCVILAEIPSPTVNAPAGIDVAQLAQIGLEFTGMTPDQAAAYTNTVNWASTLVIPIPKNAATYQQVSVDGVTGTLIQRAPDDAPEYALIWVKNGIIYAIGGLGSNSTQAIQMANSLP